MGGSSVVCVVCVVYMVCMIYRWAPKVWRSSPMRGPVGGVGAWRGWHGSHGRAVSSRASGAALAAAGLSCRTLGPRRARLTGPVGGARGGGGGGGEGGGGLFLGGCGGGRGGGGRVGRDIGPQARQHHGPDRAAWGRVARGGLRHRLGGLGRARAVIGNRG